MPELTKGPKFLVRDSGTSSWAENVGRVPWALFSQHRICERN